MAPSAAAPPPFSLSAAWARIPATLQTLIILAMVFTAGMAATSIVGETRKLPGQVAQHELAIDSLRPLPVRMARIEAREDTTRWMAERNARSVNYLACIAYRQRHRLSLDYCDALVDPKDYASPLEIRR